MIKDHQFPRLTSFSKNGGCGCKLSKNFLLDLLHTLSKEKETFKKLLIGTDTSDDSAAYELDNGQILLSTTDFFTPIVDDPYHFGQIAATNALSDIYAMGGKPILAIAIVGMPINSLPKVTISRILQGGKSICKKAKIPIGGGHSINSAEPIYGLSVNGLVNANYLKKNSQAKPGSLLILGKGLGTGILTNAFRKNLLSETEYQSMIETMTQLNYPGEILGRCSNISAMTDVTGFGLLGHLLEIAIGSNLTAKIEFSKVPLLNNAKNLVRENCFTSGSKKNLDACQDLIYLSSDLNEVDKVLLTDPQTSGGLLISCTADSVDKILKIFHKTGFFSASVIGETIPFNGNYVEVSI